MGGLFCDGGVPTSQSEFLANVLGEVLKALEVKANGKCAAHPFPLPLPRHEVKRVRFRGPDIQGLVPARRTGRYVWGEEF